MSYEMLMVGAAMAWALWTVARGWRSMAAAERRLAAWRVASMIGLGAIGWTMATRVDAGATGDWPQWARTAWGIALLGCLFASLHAWWRLVGFADLRRAPRGSFDAPAGAGERPTLRTRRGVGSRLTLGMGAVHGLAFFGVLAFVQRRPGLVLVGAGFVGMLALSGAAGGMAYHLLDPLRRKGESGRRTADLLTVLAYGAASVILICAGVLLAARVAGGGA